MSRAAINTFLSLGRRSYAAAAAAEVPRASTVAALTRAAAEDNATAKREIFWMRDPKTGNWIPENRFSDVDVAELRAKLLSKKE